MDVLVRAKDDFIHGPYNLTRGQEAVMNEHLARDLAHLVEVQSGQKSAPPRENKMAAEPANKGNFGADGKVQQSSALPVAQASQGTTAKPSEGGGKQGRTAK